MCFKSNFITPLPETPILTLSSPSNPHPSPPQTVHNLTYQTASSEICLAFSGGRGGSSFAVELPASFCLSGFLGGERRACVSSSSRTDVVVVVVFEVAVISVAGTLVLGLLGMLSFSAGAGGDGVSVVELWLFEDWWWCRRRRWRRKKKKKKAMVQMRMRRVEAPMTIPAMAPALKWCCVWVGGGGFVFVTDTEDGGGEWSMVTIFGEELAGDSACETEKFPRSKSTSRYASWKNARPSVYWFSLDARRRGK